MKLLEDMTIWQRIALTLVIVLVILFALALIGWSSGRWDEAPAQEQLYQGVPIDQHLLAIDKRALDDAYRDHLKLLWSVWLKDDVKVTQRINNGLRISRHAYAVAAEQIERREREAEGKKP
jgi:hypothetical protein